jgi:hypothetical protein
MARKINLSITRMQPVPAVLNGLRGIMKAILKGRLFEEINDE